MILAWPWQKPRALVGHGESRDFADARYWSGHGESHVPRPATARAVSRNNNISSNARNNTSHNTSSNSDSHIKLCLAPSLRIVLMRMMQLV